MNIKITKKKKMKLYLTIGVFAFCGMLFNKAYGQLNPLSSQYYSNTYLANPAMAGIAPGMKIFAAFRKQWNNIPGSPVTQNINGNYGFNKVGIGLNINNDKAGLQRQTRVLGTFAYHIPLDGEGQHLSFGLSLGFMNQRLDLNALRGDQGDILIGDYNERQTYLDGDFGVAYTNNNLTVEASIPNLKSFFKKDVIKLANVATFYTAIAYKISLSNNDTPDEIELEPKVVYRGIKGFNNVWDGGLQVALASRQIFVTGIYHSNESATFGIGMDFKKKYLISAMYTTNTAELNQYLSGGFEINLGLSF